MLIKAISMLIKAFPPSYVREIEQPKSKGGWQTLGGSAGWCFEGHRQANLRQLFIINLHNKNIFVCLKWIP